MPPSPVRVGAPGRPQADRLAGELVPDLALGVVEPALAARLMNDEGEAFAALRVEQRHRRLARLGPADPVGADGEQPGRPRLGGGAHAARSSASSSAGSSYQSSGRTWPPL